MNIIDDRLIHQIAGAIRAGALTKEQIEILDDAANEWEETCQRPRRGVIARWWAGETYGFIDEAETGDPWFVSRVDEPRPPGGLAEGDVVEFSGSPLPEPRKRYPTAGGIRQAAVTT